MAYPASYPKNKNLTYLKISKILGKFKREKYFVFVYSKHRKKRRINMALDSINEVRQNGINCMQTPAGKRIVQNDSILNFIDKSIQDITNHEPSDAKIKTEILKNSIMKRVDTSKSRLPRKDIETYLGFLIELAQQLNGVQKNKLRPNGTPEQNELFYTRIQEMIGQMYQHAQEVPGLSIVQNSRTGLYKLRINDVSFNIPERKVEIKPTMITDYRAELEPVIVD